MNAGLLATYKDKSLGRRRATCGGVRTAGRGAFSSHGRDRRVYQGRPYTYSGRLLWMRNEAIRLAVGRPGAVRARSGREGR